MDYRGAFLLMVVLTVMTLCIKTLYLSYPWTENSEVNEMHIREFNSFKVQNINCKRILDGEKTEILRAKSMVPKGIPDDETVLRHTANCVHFRTLYGYDNIINTVEEEQFPIAFNILLYKDVAQVEILLRAIYRPQNYYCLHVDGFSPDPVHKAAKSLAGCFDNVFIVSKTENVVYESFQRLKADINCMADHLVKPDWKYLINIPGQEYPLKTNAEIVQILKMMNNTNDISCTRGVGAVLGRILFKFMNVYGENGTYSIVNTGAMNTKPPHGIVVAKGSAYGVFTRQFVKYMINNQIAKDFLEWCRTILSPDEYYWSSLNYNPHLQVPGAIKGKVLCQTKHLLATFVAWHYGRHPNDCQGKWLRHICVFGPGDLQDLIHRRALFANKFELQYSYTAIQCLSEWLHNKTLSPQAIDEQFYKDLYFNKTHNLPV